MLTTTLAQSLAAPRRDHARPAERIRSLEEITEQPSRRARTLVRITPEMRLLADELREPGETLSGFFQRLMSAEARRKRRLEAVLSRAASRSAQGEA